MIDRSKVAIVIPVYNHGTRISDVVWKAFALGSPIFVVDDGSTDGTATILSSMENITVLTHQQNIGKGAALRTGFKAAQQSCNWAITIDADGQHKPEDAANLLNAVEDNQRPIVIGMRQGMERDHVPWTSKFGRKFSNFWVWASGGPFISDSQSGFRLYPLPESLDLPVKPGVFNLKWKYWCGHTNRAFQSLKLLCRWCIRKAQNVFLIFIRGKIS